MIYPYIYIITQIYLTCREYFYKLKSTCILSTCLLPFLPPITTTRPISVRRIDRPIQLFRYQHADTDLLFWWRFINYAIANPFILQYFLLNCKRVLIDCHSLCLIWHTNSQRYTNMIFCDSMCPPLKLLMSAMLSQKYKYWWFYIYT